MRHTLAALAAATAIVLMAGCTPTTTPTATATAGTPTSATPSSTPSRTYGPNQTAAMATVTAYYDWINATSKEPLKRDFTQLNKLAEGDGLSYGVSGINYLLQTERHQVGDLVIVAMVPDAEQASQIGVAICVDASNAVIVDSKGQVIQPDDGLTRRMHSLTVRSKDGRWLVVGNTGGNTSC